MSKVKVARGACFGLAVGSLISVVELARALSQPFSGNRPALACYLFAFLATSGALLGALTAAWLELGSTLSSKLRSPWRARWAYAALAGLPVALFLVWVPTSWVTANWSWLTLRQRSVAVALYVALVGASIAGARLCTRWLSAPSAGSRKRALVDLALALGLSLSAAAVYWADANVYPGLYVDLHSGLAGAFVMIATAVCALARKALASRGLIPEKASPRLRWLVQGIVAAAVATLVVSEWLRPKVFDKSGALIFNEALSFAQHAADFDRDGSPGVLGGLDCAGFDARRGVGRLDIPENGVDEDCSGSDARWPPQLQLPAPKRAASRMNVVLITVDSLRADHLSAYGYSRNTSPFLAQWASDAWRFAHAFSQDTKTWESTSSLVSGRYPSNLVRDYDYPSNRGKKDYVFHLSPQVPVLAELLAQHGYVTRGASMLGLLRNIGLDRGFQRFDVSKTSVETALRFLRRPHRPFFLWVHLQWPHFPYQKQAGYDFGNAALDRYDSEIAYTDAQIGRILTELSNRNLDKRTIVAITSDHGEEFGEHGSFHHGGPPSRVQTHVPLLVKVPRAKPAVIETPVELVDLLPTLCELTGFLERCDGFDGQSLLATVAGKRSADYVGAYAENYARNAGVQRRGLFTGRWRLVQDFTQNRVALYDTSVDPEEQRNVADGNEAIWRPLLEQLAVRPLRFASTLFHTEDPEQILRGLTRVQQEPLLALALDRLARTKPSKEQREPYLKALLERPQLSATLKAKIETMLR